MSATSVSLHHDRMITVTELTKRHGPRLTLDGVSFTGSSDLRVG